ASLLRVGRQIVDTLPAHGSQAQRIGREPASRSSPPGGKVADIAGCMNDCRLELRGDQEDPAIEVVISNKIDDLGIFAGDRDRLDGRVVEVLRGSRLGDPHPAREGLTGWSLGGKAETVVTVFALNVGELVFDQLEITLVVSGVQG